MIGDNMYHKRDKRREFPVAVAGINFVLLTAKSKKKVINSLIPHGHLFNTNIRKPKPVATGNPMNTPEMQTLYQSLA